jgi:DNA-binding NarL/FixJ family response regulator
MMSSLAEVLDVDRRFVILDDEPLVVEALTTRVRLQIPFSTVIYAGPSLGSAVQAALARGCECALVDLELQEMSAAPASATVAAFAVHGIPVIAMSRRPSVAMRQLAAEAGAQAFVDKHRSPELIHDACTAVLDGQTWWGDHTDSSSSDVVLSTQERRALMMYASGMKQDMVARRMGIASSTVKHYLDRARRKYNEAGIPARTKLELHELAKREGLIP